MRVMPGLLATRRESSASKPSPCVPECPTPAWKLRPQPESKNHSAPANQDGHRAGSISWCPACPIQPRRTSRRSRTTTRCRSTPERVGRPRDTRGLATPKLTRPARSERSGRGRSKADTGESADREARRIHLNPELVRQTVRPVRRRASIPMPTGPIRARSPSPVLSAETESNTTPKGQETGANGFAFNITCKLSKCYGNSMRNPFIGYLSTFVYYIKEMVENGRNAPTRPLPWITEGVLDAEYKGVPPPAWLQKLKAEFRKAGSTPRSRPHPKTQGTRPVASRTRGRKGTRRPPWALTSNGFASCGRRPAITMDWTSTSKRSSNGPAPPHLPLRRARPSMTSSKTN